MLKTMLKILSYCGVMLLGMALTIALLPREQAPKGSQQGKLYQLLDFLEEYHVEDVDRTALEDAAAEAILTATGDRWAYYVSADEYATYVEENQNAYVGIGVTVTMNEETNRIEVVDVTPGGPADGAGMLTHDYIVGVNGDSCLDKSLEEVQKLIRGPEGTEVSLTIQRQEQTLELSMLRATVQVQVVFYEMLPSGYGYIAIDNFHLRSAKDTIAAIEELTSLGAKGLIFDVRFNPGGYKNEMVDVLDYILPEGKLFVTEDYLGNSEIDYSDDDCIQMPMAVLVNEYSYSAAEFFAAALREYDYAIVVGHQTTGKGHYQIAFNLSDGSVANFSVGRYYTPNGVSLDHVGITPDVLVEVDEETWEKIYFDDLTGEDDPQIKAAVDALESQVSP